MGNIFHSAVAGLVAPQIRGAKEIIPSYFFNNFPSLTEGGKKVNKNTALTLSAFYCGINSIANSIAMLPFSVYTRKDGMRKHNPNHPADYLLHNEPNPTMTTFTFKHIMVLAVLLRGNAYALIERNAAGRISALRYIDPDQVTVIDHEGKLFYQVKSNVYSSDEIIHITGFSFDGITGKSVIEYAADNLGVSLAAQKFGSESLTDRGISQGVLESDLSVKAPKKKEISTAFSNAMSARQKHRAPLLDEGMKYKPITLKPQEAQFIETYASGVSDVARWLDIPLHKLHAKGEGGYNFITQMSIEYRIASVQPMADKFKQELERKIFTPIERTKGNYIYQNFQKILQVDPESRAKYYKDMLYMKAMNPNEIRELEDMNPYVGGDEYLQMSNLLTQVQVKNMEKNGKTTNTGSPGSEG